jgi:hypothetical protein
MMNSECKENVRDDDDDGEEIEEDQEDKGR